MVEPRQSNKSPNIMACPLKKKRRKVEPINVNPGNRSTIESAIDILDVVKEIGPKGVRAYTLSRLSEDYLMRSMKEDLALKHETFLQEVDRIGSTCFDVADYFRMWLNDECLRYPAIKYKDISAVPFGSLSGVYYLYLSMREESHAFVWVIVEDLLIYCGGYGGVLDIFVNYHNKEQYFENFKEAMEGSLDAYEAVFGLEEAAVAKVTFESVRIEKSLRYY